MFSKVDETESISTVKNVIAERLKIAPIQQRLVYKGKTLTGWYLLALIYFHCNNDNNWDLIVGKICFPSLSLFARLPRKHLNIWNALIRVDRPHNIRLTILVYKIVHYCDSHKFGHTNHTTLFMIDVCGVFFPLPKEG